MVASAARTLNRSRRSFLARTALALPAGLAAGRRARAADQRCPQTLDALAYAHQREIDAHRRYLAFASKASREGYRGIAYMFTAFAASEGIHARNFRTLIVQLGGQAPAAPTPIAVAGTKQNLIVAVADEIDSIDKLYPGTLERMQPEGQAEAMRLVRFAWESERQHRDLIQKIRRFSPVLFERVAKAIDEKTGSYFVCEHCGSTLNKVPAGACPICASPPEQYRKVPVPA